MGWLLVARAEISEALQSLEPREMSVDPRTALLKPCEPISF